MANEPTSREVNNNVIPRITIKNRWIPRSDWKRYMVEDTDILYPQLWNETCEVEVLTVHFQKGTMRIRFAGSLEGLMPVQDISAHEFFEQIDLVKK